MERVIEMYLVGALSGLVAGTAISIYTIFANYLVELFSQNISFSIHKKIIIQISIILILTLQFLFLILLVYSLT